MPFPPRFLEELRDRVSLSQLIGRKVKLTRRGREYLGLCPFHHEKTPSFTVNDDKGFYHCFGCGAHGDAIRFLTESEKMPFMEAVEHLAHLAGLSVPQMTASDVQKQEALHNDLAVMEAACTYFQEQLFSPRGEKARNYLQKRGITKEVAQAFRLGYAPSGSGLLAHLTEKGFSLSVAAALGLIVESSEKRARHDYFYDRVMFPIFNRRQKVIAFGGRLLEKGEPKYLNSPETALFHKGEQLYALSNAAPTIRQKNKAVLVEGYMDVIALHSAGFTNAVAPLGTAFTEWQLKLLWQSCDEPIICFDGDLAGRKAAVRALYRALDILTPGKSLQFVFLPDPFDPDDMIRKKSPLAFQEALDGAQTFADTLWNTLLENRSIDTPERFAKFEKDVEETVRRIKDERVRSSYEREMKNRLWRLAHQRKRQTAETLYRAPGGIFRPTEDRELRLLTAYLICYPQEGQKILETGFVPRFHTPEMQVLFEKIAERMIEKPDITGAEMKTYLTEEMKFSLPREVDLIEQSGKETETVRAELDKWSDSIHLKALKKEKEEKLKLFAKNQTSELWNEIKQITEDIEKFNAVE